MYVECDIPIYLGSGEGRMDKSDSRELDELLIMDACTCMYVSVDVALHGATVRVGYALPLSHQCDAWLCYPIHLW